MDQLLTDQFARLLDSLGEEDPWPRLHESGFLDLLVPEAQGGGGAGLEALFPLVFECGRRVDAPAAVAETMAVRLFEPGASAAHDVEGLAGRPLAAALAAGQIAGAMSSLLALTVDYAVTRTQFGRPIGGFQAVQGQVAVLAEEAEAARTAAQLAFVGAATEISERRVGVAKIRCNQAAERGASIAHAVHGAIGISEDHVLHRHTRRLRSWRDAHGGASWWSRRLGEWLVAEQYDLASAVRQL